MNGRRTFVGLGMCLAVFSAAAGNAASGCSSYDTRIIAPEEGGPPKEAGGDVAVGSMCPSDVPVEATTLLWKPPNTPQEGRCQDDDLVAMKNFLTANPGATNEDFENFVKNRDTTCHDCIFGDADGQTWPPAPVKGGKVLTFNVGACYAIATGRQQCGAAVQHAWDCEFEACVQCASASALATCRTKARAGVCLPYEQKVPTECTGASVDDICGSPFDSIRIQCVTAVRPVTDAGTDASDAADAADQ
jgi:hypothetical protein